MDENTGKINGKAKKSPWNCLPTFISDNRLDKIAGAKFRRLISITANIKHLSMI